MKQAIVIVGNPKDGFSHIGPFADMETALKFVEGVRALEHAKDWWLVELEPRADYE